MIKNMQYLCKAVQNYNPWLRKVQMSGNSSFRLFGTAQNKIFSSPSTSRLNLDFYKSRNFEYSFLEMPTDPNNVEYVHQALKELKLYYDSNGEIVKKINDAYLDIQEYLNENMNDVNNVLKFNNKYAGLVKNVKENPILGEKAVIYSQTIQMIERLLSDDVLNENISYNILSPISQLLLNLGIIDLSLWKKVIHSTFLFPEKFTSSADLKRTIMCIVTFLKRFNFSENNETGFTRYHFFFKESELPSILTRHMISRFFVKFETHFLYNPEHIRSNINDICIMINMVCDIIAKLTRISFVNHFEERKFLKKFESILIANLKYIAPHHCLDICTSYLNMGFHNNVLLKEFLNYFQNNISSVDADRVLLSIVRAWKAEGKYDEGIYSGFVKSSLKNFIQNPKHLLKLPGLAYDLIIFQLKDEEIWYLLLDTICCIPFNELRYFQKKSLHLLFQNLKDQSNIVIDISRYSELINCLSKFCIGTNLKYDFTELKIPEIEDKGFVNCCDKHTIERYRKTFKEKMLAHPELYKKSLSFNEQIHTPNFHENFIRKAVEQYFPKFLQVPIKITHELPVCSYKVDIALEIPDVYDKIAIEISGLAYTFETGAFIGKKKLKFEFLRKNGWIPIQVNLGTNMSHNLMAIASDFNDEKVAKTVYELLRQEIKAQLGKDLPALKNSKWMTSKSQDQSDTRVKTSI